MGCWVLTQRIDFKLIAIRLILLMLPSFDRSKHILVCFLIWRGSIWSFYQSKLTYCSFAVTSATAYSEYARNSDGVVKTGSGSSFSLNRSKCLLLSAFSSWRSYSSLSKNSLLGEYADLASAWWSSHRLFLGARVRCSSSGSEGVSFSFLIGLRS